MLTSPKLTTSLAAITLVRSFQPALDVWVSKLLIDAVAAAVMGGSAAASASTIWVLAGIQLASLVIGSLLRAVGNVCQQLLQERVSMRVQLDIMVQADRLDLSSFEDSKFYDRLQQAQREAASRPVQMVAELFGLARTTISFLAMVGLLASLSPLIAVLALVTPIPSFISNTRYGWQGYQMMRRQSPLRRMMSYLTTVQTTDTYRKEVQIFGIGPYLIDRYRDLSSKYYLEAKALIVRRYLAAFGWGSLSLLTTSGTYLYVALQAVAGKLTIGDLGLFTRAASSVQEDFQGILYGFSSLYEHGLYISTLFDLLAIEPTISVPEHPVPFPRPITKGIEFRHVTFGYPGQEKPALTDVSFQIQPGETIAVVGPNGAGKTTLVKLLARLYDPIEGDVLIDGINVKDLDPFELRKEIGAIFQDYVTYQFSAGENIGLGHVEKLDDKEAIASAAQQGGAEGVIDKLPEGYDTILGKWFEGGHQLSGGEWQKIALSRAFMREAQVLILDEPTASLDAIAEWDLFQRIRALTNGRTAIFISHRFSTVRTADRIFVLQNGRLVEEGAHDDLVADNGLYADLFEKQAASYR